MQSYTGIPGIRQQDMAVTESMGPIYKRWQEHLGTTDALIIRTRRRMIEAARALREHGHGAARRRQPGAVPPALRRRDPAARRQLVGRRRTSCATAFPARWIARARPVPR